MKPALFLLSLLPLSAFPVSVKVDAEKITGKINPIWRFFGADEPNYATMPNGKKLLGELGELKPEQVYFRAHSLLVTGDGTPALKWGSTNAYTEDEKGNPIYDWKIVDEIFDTYRSNHVRPYVQIGFMPQALSVKPDPYQHSWGVKEKYDKIYTGWAYPPKDYQKWEELVYQWAKHNVERYGEKEVLQWYWETWNEPNIGYWQGKREEFYKLHDHAIKAVRRAIPNAKVGGPDLAGGKGGDYLEKFLNHCLNGKNEATGGTGTPLDFISFHAKGSPKFQDGHVIMGIANQLRDMDGAFATIAKFPTYKNKPIVIGESDPEGCAACQGANLAYRNGTLYAAYTAASFPRKIALAEKHGVNLEGALTWAFEFENQPYFAGFRSLATNGIDKPVLNTFRIFSKMHGDKIQATSNAQIPLDDIVKHGVRKSADVSVYAARENKKITIMLCHYHDEHVLGEAAEITLTIDNPPAGKPKITQYLIDESHSNSHTTWLALGSPQAPTADQISEMQKASALATVPAPAIKDNSLTLNLSRQAVTLIELEYP